MAPERPTRSREHILLLLKTRGSQTVARLASKLELTPMAVRQHLDGLRDAGWVTFDEERHGVGRPRRIWRLTPAGDARFPQGYADLTVEMIASVQRVFGAAGLERLIRRRTRDQVRAYRQRLPPHDAPLARRVAALARLRSEEGYMAEWSRHRDGSFTLVENHCPICVAARACSGLCVGEQELFQAALGPDVALERREHLLDGARRCTYRIRPRKAARPRRTRRAAPA